MKQIVGVVLAACLVAGCSGNYDGRYPIDTIRIKTTGPGHAQPVSETFPLNAWFEIDSENSIRVHAGGVTSVYEHPMIVKTSGGFEAVSAGPRGKGEFTWSFEKGDPDGLCSLTFTHDRVHYLTLVSKGKEHG
jgi:hypothetical protein